MSVVQKHIFHSLVGISNSSKTITNKSRGYLYFAQKLWTLEGIGKLRDNLNLSYIYMTPAILLLLSVAVKFHYILLDLFNSH